MPIYAYRCESCGFEKDVLQKMSDAPLTQCPQCEKDAFRKQVTAAGFQLKGSGWYVTDFRGGSGSSNGANASSNGTGAAKPEATSETKAETKSESAGAPPAASSAPAATDA
ncbi:FmdB family zinc ribbon protein [Trinickia sp.]|uniref:FmdB family zinc ribbon protein n=1 Tax=Trinickia sp. TaxID=2571163 RepID=UPI003F80A7F7